VMEDTKKINLRSMHTHTHFDNQFQSQVSVWVHFSDVGARAEPERKAELSDQRCRIQMTTRRHQLCNSIPRQIAFSLLFSRSFLALVGESLELQVQLFFSFLNSFSFTMKSQFLVLLPFFCWLLNIFFSLSFVLVV
jgi:hypothetical protein